MRSIPLPASVVKVEVKAGKKWHTVCSASMTLTNTSALLLMIPCSGIFTSVCVCVLCRLLIELDGVEPLKQVTVIAATNRPDIIDSALLRPGRIDRICYVSPPDQEACAAILRICLGRMSAAEDLLASIPAFADECYTLGLSGAEIESVCREAALKAMEQDQHAQFVSKDNFQSALKHVVPRITKEMREFYDNYCRQSAIQQV